MRPHKLRAMRAPHEDLFQFTKSILTAVGCSDRHAHTAATVLLSADLRGVDSHGVARLKGYTRLIAKGRVNTAPQPKIIHETPSTAVLDGDAGLGLVVGPEAMKVAIEKARQVGTGWVSVKNSNHFGIAGYHSMLALKEDCIGISMTNASPIVAPTFSKERLLGTNPIAVAIPSDKEPPFVLDMATTTAANGKLEILQRKGAKAPEGWIQDADGMVQTDPNGVKDGGALLPLGSDREHGSHKGYGLSAVVDIFSAVLSGANYGPWAPPFVAFMEPAPDPVGKGLGHFFGAMRVDAFRPAGEFKSHMDNWIRRFRNAEPILEGHSVLIPGDPEREMEKERRTSGIPLHRSVVEDLKGVAQELGVDFLS